MTLWREAEAAGSTDGGGAGAVGSAGRAARVTLLGPQRLRPTLSSTLTWLEPGARIATVTAGWQEREPDDAELHEHLGGRSVNLTLYARAESIFERDLELANAHRLRQEQLQQLQELYRLRLDYAMQAALQLLRREGDSDLLDAERTAAIEAVRTLDARHLERVRELHDSFEARWRPQERDSVQQHRSELHELLRDAAALAIAGGHVAVLLNRLRLFDIGRMAGERPIVAWSAGAMAISEQVVLFHDRPPHGPGHAEVLEVGLGLCRGIVPLPHARRRLDLEDAARLSLFARRFAPMRCVPMDEGARLEMRGEEWSAPTGALRMQADGRLAGLGVA